MEPGEEYLRCEDCGLAFSIETTAAGERCSTCDGELVVIRAVEVRHDDGLRLMLGGDAGEQDARTAVLGRRVESVEHDLDREHETLALFLEGGDVLVLEANVERPGALAQRMTKVGPYRTVQSVVRLIESNPMVPDGAAFFTSARIDEDAPTPKWRKYFDGEPVFRGLSEMVPVPTEGAISVDTYGPAYSITRRVLPWWHLRALWARRPRVGGGWAQLAEVVHPSADFGSYLADQLVKRMRDGIPAWPPLGVVEDPYLPPDWWGVVSPPDAWSVEQREEFVAAACAEYEKDRLRVPFEELIAKRQAEFEWMFRSMIPLVVPAREDPHADAVCRATGGHEGVPERIVGDGRVLVLRCHQCGANRWSRRGWPQSDEPELLVRWPYGELS